MNYSILRWEPFLTSAGGLAIKGMPLTPLVNQRVTGNAAFMRKILVLAILAAPAWADWLENYRSGENFLAQGRTAIALECLQSAAREAETAGAPDAQLAAVYDALGRADMGSGRYRDGKRYFERALRLAADGPLEAQATVTSNLGQACQALGELVRAEQLFRQALTAMPNRADLWNLLGGVLSLQRRYKGLYQR